MFNADPFSIIVLMVGLSLLPFLAMVATSYLKIVVVLSLIRNALGIQSIPPNMVVNALALILTFYIMAPILGESWDICSRRLAENRANARSAERTEAPKGGPIAAASGMGVLATGGAELEARTRIMAEAAEPFRRFLLQETSEKQVAYFVRTAERLWAKRDANGELKPATVDPKGYFVLLPAFCVSELTKAFQIGFLVYLPFIAIDIIVSNILLAMGMMMVSPVTISLPFKLLLFVMVNGWTLLIQGLVQSYMH